MLCKFRDFHGGGYEECCLLGYKKPVHTSQEAHGLSTTDPSRLMLCTISGFHGDEYDECRLLGCGGMWIFIQLTYRINVSPPSSRWK
jgi:hypothetical protein